MDPFIELKQHTFKASLTATNVLLAQLNADIEQNIDVVNNRSTIEQQFYNYMEVRYFSRRKFFRLIVVFDIFRFLFGVINVIYPYQAEPIVPKSTIHFIK